MCIGKGMVSKCYLNNGIVRKQYLTPFEDYSGRNIQTHWKSELRALRKLKGKKHFPQLISEDHGKKIIYMSYCGERLTSENIPMDWKKQCAEIEHSLKQANIYHQDMIGKDSNPTPPYHKNIHILDGIIYLIDFGIWANQQSNGHTTITELVSKVAGNRK